MKLWVILLLYLPVLGQNPPESSVFLFDIERRNDSISFQNGRIISENKAYNNQASFYNNNTLLYAGATDGQTDIVSYDIKQNSTKILTQTLGSEFSPRRIPGQDDIAAVRLDPDGNQKLYQYSVQTGNEIELLSDLKVGYFDFYKEDKILASVVTAKDMDLHYIDLETKKDSLIVTNVGRSLHKIPETNTMSYALVNESGGKDIYMLDMEDGMNSYFICALPAGVEDYTWLNATQLLLGTNNELFIYDTLGEGKWQKIVTLNTRNLYNITRLAVSPDGTKLAVVAQIPRS